MSKSIKDILLGVKINKIEGGFYCHGNKLTSLEGGPKTVEGDFYCHDNSKEFSEEEVRKYIDVKGNIRV